MRKMLIVTFLFFSNFILIFPLEYNVSSKIDWPNGKYILTIDYPLEDSDRALPALKNQTEQTVARKLKSMLFKQMQTFVLDSHTNIYDYTKKNASVVAEIYTLADKAHRVFSLFSEDMRTVKIQYSIFLYPDVAEIFISHSNPAEIDPILQFIPSADFSGIVIYIQNSLPYFGRDTQGLFTPSLFPRIYDDNMNLIMDKTRVSPAAIKKWGVAGYRTDLNLTEAAGRIGYTPLKIAARGLFGINNTDIIIPGREAAKILSRKSNIDLIREGRILIVYVPE